MAETPRILQTIERLYAAAAGQEAWMPALESIVELLNGRHATLYLSGADGSSKLTAYAGLTEQEEALFRSSEAVRLYAPYAAAAPVNIAFASGQLWPISEFERSELYNEILRPVKGFYGASALRPMPSGLLNVTICRQRSDSDFETAEIETLQALLPHIATAVELHQRLRARQKAIQT